MGDCTRSGRLVGHPEGSPTAVPLRSSLAEAGTDVPSLPGVCTVNTAAHQGHPGCNGTRLPRSSGAVHISRGWAGPDPTLSVSLRDVHYVITVLLYLLISKSPDKLLRAHRQQPVSVTASCTRTSWQFSPREQIHPQTKTTQVRTKGFEIIT